MLFASALSSSTAIVGYLALFATIGFGFIFVNLLVGYFLRPYDPHPEKQEIYECGEPTIGSSFVQFDLRFYVVALIFIIFDVEVAFLFPWATVFGKVTNLQNDRQEAVRSVDGETTFQPAVASLYKELGVRSPSIPVTWDGSAMPASVVNAAVQQPGSVDPSNASEGARPFHNLATLALVAGATFFTVLFVGFAYEWKTGALDWVKSIRAQKATKRGPTISIEKKPTPQSSVLSA